MRELAPVAAPTQPRSRVGSGGEAAQLDAGKLTKTVVRLEAQLAGHADVAQYENELRVDVEKELARSSARIAEL